MIAASGKENVNCVFVKLLARSLKVYVSVRPVLPASNTTLVHNESIYSE